MGTDLRERKERDPALLALPGANDLAVDEDRARDVARRLTGPREGPQAGPLDGNGPDLAGVPADVDAARRRRHSRVERVARAAVAETRGNLADEHRLALGDPVDLIGQVLELDGPFTIARQAAEREDADIPARDDVVGATPEPDLDQRWVLPRVGLCPLDPRVERDHPSAWDRILE